MPVSRIWEAVFFGVRLSAITLLLVADKCRINKCEINGFHKITMASMSHYYGDSIFWIDVEKIKPNPQQPRKEFDVESLKDLSESIRMYGVLQPLVVTRREITREDGSLMVEYELISGERRLRASRIACISQVPAVIRNSIDDDRTKLELAIIENLQREDLNPVDRAKAFQRLVDEFNFKHIDVAAKVGKSREYVSNSLRILSMPLEMVEALSQSKISEGHTRPILMLGDRPKEQSILFKEIVMKRLTVREAESIARRIAYDKVRKKNQSVDPEIVELEEQLAESLGTRVHIERGENGGRIQIDFFSPDDLKSIIGSIRKQALSNSASEPNGAGASVPGVTPVSVVTIPTGGDDSDVGIQPNPVSTDGSGKEEEDMYSVNNFSI